MIAVTGHYILYTMLNRFNFSLVRGVCLRNSCFRLSESSKKNLLIWNYTCSNDLLVCTLKTWKSNLVRTTRFWNNLYQLRSKPTNWKSNNNNKKKNNNKKTRMVHGGHICSLNKSKWEIEEFRKIVSHSLFAVFFFIIIIWLSICWLWA
jgi:hypothetical protein